MLLPDPDQARDWLSLELSRPEYQPSMAERIQQWLSDLLDWLTRGLDGGTVPGWLLLIPAAIAVVGLAFALSRLRRAHEAKETGTVFDDVRRPAIDHRALARAAYSEADYATALIESVRALTAGLVERDLLVDVPGLTALEVQQRCRSAFPAKQSDVVDTIWRFDEVRYGGRRAERSWAQQAIDLEAAISTLEPSTSAPDGPVLAVPR